MAYRSFWVEWFGLLGRELGSPSRVYAGNPDAFLAFIDRCIAAKLPCFCSVQPYRRRDEPAGLEKLFFDYDCKTVPPNLDKAWRDVTGLCERLKRIRVEPLIIQTFRGYHVYIWLWHLIEFEPRNLALAREVYRMLQETLLDGWRYSTLDQNVIGDVKRLSRVPYSFHESGVECTPVDLNREPLQLESPREFQEHGLQEALFKEAVQQVERKKIGREILAVFNSFKPRRRRWVPTSGPRTIRLCFQEALKRGEMPHLQRLALVNEAYCAGLSVDEIVNLYRRLKDFDEAKTRYQVTWLLKMNPHPKRWRCSTIMAKGFCVKNRCSIFHHLKKENIFQR